MEFAIEFYETISGRSPMQEFLNDLKQSVMKRKTNFNAYLEEQLKDPDFAMRFKKAGEAWDIALQLATLREECGLSQKELANLVGTSQQQISRQESPSYEGHSLSMLRRVSEVLGATIHIQIQRSGRPKHLMVAENKPVMEQSDQKRNASAIKQGRQANDAIVGVVTLSLNQQISQTRVFSMMAMN